MNRRACDEFMAGICPGYNPVAPWDHIFRRAALDRDYWGEFVRQPALKFIATGTKRKGSPIGSLTGEIDVDTGEEEKARKRTTNRERAGF